MKRKGFLHPQTMIHKFKGKTKWYIIMLNQNDWYLKLMHFAVLAGVAAKASRHSYFRLHSGHRLDS